MLRITTMTKNAAEVTFRLEGRVEADWAAVLEDECRRMLAQRRRVKLDFSRVTFVDRLGATILARLRRENLHIVNCPALIQALLEPTDHGRSTPHGAEGVD